MNDKYDEYLQPKLNLKKKKKTRAIPTEFTIIFKMQMQIYSRGKYKKNSGK